MLPPLNLADGKGGFFPRKPVDGRGATSSSNGTSSLNNVRPSPRVQQRVRLLPASLPHQSRGSGNSNSIASPRPTAECPPGSNTSQPPALTEMSLIPREFFVVETNAVLPPTQYPPMQYQSTLKTDGSWETVVFPALTPHNRQQVLYLRQTLDKMRAAIPRLEDEEHVGREDPKTELYGDAKTADERRRLVLEYTENEIRVCSFCFHELTRQIKCICKEQSELLLEIRQRYDDAVTRLVGQVGRLSRQNAQQREQLSLIDNQLQQVQEDNTQLTHRLQEIEEMQKTGPPSDITLKAHTRRISIAKARTKVDAIDEESNEGDDDDSMSDDDGVDEEEAEWRRQRKAAASSFRPTLGARRDSLLEVNMAAKRLQMAFQKYQSRKEQSRLTQRVEKGAAAMDIQRSYRGFRERKLALHRRAVVRTIMRRREEQAAVELMQANVRAYLLKRRHSAKTRGTELEAPPPQLLPESIQPMSLPSEVEKSEESTVIVDVAAVELKSDENEPQVVDRPKEDGNPGAANGGRNAREMLVRLLTTFRELTSAISIFQLGEPQASESGESASTDDNIAASDSEAASGETLPRATSLSTNVSNSSLFHTSSPFAEDDVQLFHQTIQQAQALVGSLCGVLGSVPEDSLGSSQLNESDTDLERNGSDNLGSLDGYSTDHGADRSEVDGPVDEEAGFKEGEQSEVLPLDASRTGHLFDQPNYSELHLDDTLWSSATYYRASSEDSAQANARLALVLASREQRKRLVALKQFISDIYDTIVGKLKELPAKHLTAVMTTRFSLALSFTEWKEQRAEIFSRAATADQAGEMTDGVNFNIHELAREHFRCKLGLKQLADAAMNNLRESIDAFAAVDSDVKRFHEFLTRERSEEELVFCCVCRYICTHRLPSNDAAGSCPASASSPHRRYPVFHPVTMREVIDLPHALELAKLLFRVDDERAIVGNDLPFVEVENAVYRQYLPTNGFHQFEAIASRFFVDADCQSIAESSANNIEVRVLNGALACGQGPPGSPPRQAGELVRATNCKQFHMKQYNTQAARSPLVRRHQQQQRSSQLLRFVSPPAVGDSDVKWLFFEEVLALLLKYRGQMNHFHLFAHWVQELFSLAGVRTARRNSSAHGSALRGGQPSANEPKLLDEAAFVETLLPLSLGPTERELRNIFHNSLRQRRLHLRMPLRAFTSVALLLLRNGLLSVSSYAPLKMCSTPSNAQGGSNDNCARDQRMSTIRAHNDDKEWRALALKWRVQEPAFEAAIEAIYQDEDLSPSVSPHSTNTESDDGSALVSVESPNVATDESRSRSAHALQLLQLRQELYDLFANRSGRGQDLQRAHEIYEFLVEERLSRVGSCRGSQALQPGVLEQGSSSQTRSLTPVYTFI